MHPIINSTNSANWKIHRKVLIAKTIFSAEEYEKRLQVTLYYASSFQHLFSKKINPRNGLEF